MQNTWIVPGLLFASMMYAGCISSPRYTSARVEKNTDNGSHSSYEEGVASYYADEFNGRKTSNGEIYNMNDFTGAHRTLPFNTKVKVTNTLTGKSVTVRINDRGPFKDDRIIDVSWAAAKSIGLVGTGTARVTLEVVEFGEATLQQKR
jgi:rare lipoprotein A (peptidoglycan hydrolase)